MKTGMIFRAALACLASACCMIGGAAAAPLPDKNLSVPAGLEPWIPWVLHGMDAELCPPDYDDGRRRRCRWPSRLMLAADASGGRFEQAWMMFAQGWVALPGSAEVWPAEVTLDRAPVPVMNRNNVPSVFVAPGLHAVAGVFHWERMPETLMIPPDTGLLRLTLNGAPAASAPDSQGRLWLQRRSAPAEAEDRHQVRIFRRMTDGIPFKLTQRLILDVSGGEREIRLHDILLPGAIPMTVDSPLPVRLGGEGDVLVQARPGKWTVEIVARFKGPVNALGPAPCPYGQEIWSFEAKNDLRAVKVEGVPAVEPARADVPENWQTFPAFLVDEGAAVALKQLRRGDPDPAPDRLALFRECWLDFDGGGYTVRDRITGVMSRQWRLELSPPALLGRVSVDGADRLITVHGDDEKPGVELRRGDIDLVADSRWEAGAGAVPAAGWDHDFDAVSGRLNLPPGWRLLTARGADVMPGTWFQRWTLLDFFLMLIIGVGVMKLKGRGWGVLALATLILIYHEPNAPRLVWLHLIGAMALLAVIPSGKVRRLVRLWGFGAAAVLLVLAVPFMVQQVRWGIYPQLSRAGYAAGWGGLSRMPLDAEIKSSADGVIAPMMKKTARRDRHPSAPEQMRQGVDAPRKTAAVFAHDPDANIQTGPGLPAWKWRSIDMKWNGPVDRTQQVRLWLLSPAVNLILAFVRVILLAVLIYGLLNLRHWARRANMKLGAPAAALLVCLTAFQAQATAPDAACPPPEILKELRNRLLAPPECLPFCAACPRMDLRLAGETLRIMMELHLAADAAVPLPGAGASWSPDAVFLDDIPADGLARDGEGTLWMYAEKGVHRVLLTGPAGDRDAIGVSLPLKPHRVAAVADGWDIQGVRPDGTAASVIQLRREKRRTQAAAAASRTITPPPFLHVRRTLRLGLTWSVSTTVKRLTAPGVPVVAAVPLIPGESVTTPGVDVERRNALINMAADAVAVQWTSTLEQTTDIRLQAPEEAPWTETWVLDASPIWHCDLSGIPVIHHQREGVWRPTWRPWPGEAVGIAVSKPKALPGRMKTIDGARLEWTPGKRFSKMALTLDLRASRGGRHDVELAPEAALKLVKIDDKIQPIRMEGRGVLIPLQPGRQTIYLEWHEPAASGVLLKGPAVNIGEEAVNATVRLNMPMNSWILWAAGPRLGPAVLFWSYALVVILAAVGLGRTPLAPLKTHQWLLLGLGLTQVSPIVALMIVGWLAALKARETYAPPEHWFYYNAAQLILAAWTLAACIGFYMAVERGLLGIPDMQIAGNNSNDVTLYWTQDRIREYMPRPRVLYLPRLVYHILMLFWALWLAVSLLKWLKWGWGCFSKGGAWKKVSLRRKKEADADARDADAPPPLKGGRLG